MTKYFLHIDLNAFFVNVELIHKPHLKGLPVVVAGKSRRSVIGSASYEARQLGINAAMPVFKAKMICKNLIVIDHGFELYQYYSDLFLNLLSTQFCDRLEIGSIDECYLEISELVKNETEAWDFANRIQNAVLAQLELPCSIGIANNKDMAKVASELKKPLGISTLYEHEIKTKLWPLKVDRLLFVGKSTNKIFADFQIHTVRDLANFADMHLLAKRVGKSLTYFLDVANGKGSTKIHVSSINDAKSISNEATFEVDLSDYESLWNRLEPLIEENHKRLKRTDLVPYKIELNFKDSNFISKNRGKKLNYPTDDLNSIKKVALEILVQYLELNSVKLRLIGINFSNLIHKKSIPEQLVISNEGLQSYNKNLLTILENVNSRFNSPVLMLGNEIKTKKPK